MLSNTSRGVWNWGTSVNDTAVTLAAGSNLLELAHVTEAV